MDDKLGILSNADIYYYMHNPKVWIETLLTDEGGKIHTAPKQSWIRIQRAWETYFMMDDGGRSTAKTYDYMLCGIAKAILLEKRMVVFFSGDARRGNSKTREYVGMWIEDCPMFADAVVPMDSVRGAAVRNRGGTTELPLKNGSLFKSYTPDWQSSGENTQSDRCNELIFNEWTSYPQPGSMVENVEPIATGTNYYRNNTMRFRAFGETLLGTPLGRQTNEQLIEIHSERKGFIPREHITDKTQPLGRCLSEFFRGFEVIFGFTYQDGVKDDGIGFPVIKTKEDIEKYFANYVDGDPVYGNKIVYDGSAKRPSDECYIYKQEHMEMIDKGDVRYGNYNISVDELGLEWDGIIFDSNVIAKARRTMLREDYDRVYGGKWTEGSSHRPYDPEDVERCRGDINIILSREEYPDDIFVLGVDAAKGTEQMRRGGDNVNKAGKGDDAGGIGVRVGKGTFENPHEVVFGFKARDVRAEPLAVQVHQAHNQIGFNLIAIDPNGAGGNLVDALIKPNIEVNGEKFKFTPLIMHDFEEAEKEGDRCLMYISRSEKLITEAFRLSDSASPFRGDDMLLDAMHTNLRNLLEKGGVVFPQRIDDRRLLQMYENKEMSKEEMNIRLDLEEMLDQLVKIKYQLDKKLPTQDKRVRTTNGVFRYARTGKKDLAYSLIYSLFVANIWGRWNEKLSEANANSFKTVYG